MSQPHLRTWVASLFTVLIFCAAALAEATPDRVQIGRDITIGEGEKVGDVVCVGCSIHARGQITGDVVVVGGHITIDQGTQVGGSVTAVYGSLRMENEVQVHGDVTVVGGALRRGLQTTITGDITAIGGAGGIILTMLAPLALLIGLGWLIFWLLRRDRQPAQVAA